jgi:hypothetical protein
LKIDVNVKSFRNGLRRRRYILCTSKAVEMCQNISHLLPEIAVEAVPQAFYASPDTHFGVGLRAPVG